MPTELAQKENTENVESPIITQNIEADFDNVIRKSSEEESPDPSNKDEI